MSKGDLLDFARLKGIEGVSSGKTKAEIIKIILGG